MPTRVRLRTLTRSESRLPARAAYPTAPPGHFAQASRILPNQTRPEPTLAAPVLLDNSQPIRKTTPAAPRATPGGGAAS